MTYKKSSVIFGGFEYHDDMKAYYQYEEYKPYYIGRNSEKSTNFIATNRQDGDEILYLGLPLYLPEFVNKNTSYIKVDDPSIAEIQGEDLVALQEGICNVICYDSNMEMIESKRFIISTFNDSSEEIATHRVLHGEDIMSHINAWDLRYWKDSVNTIMDMCFMLQAREFRYEFAAEPKFGGIDGFK